VIPQTLTVFRPVACVEVNREEPGMLRSVRLFRLAWNLPLILRRTQ
jgi:hypothetical protein